MSPPAQPPATLHGSAVAVDGRAVLIFGRPGSGKSGLALRLIALGAALVADDRLVLRGDGDRLTVAPPPTLAGLIEARGVGILTLPYVPCARPGWVVDLDQAADARIPQACTRVVEGFDLPLIRGQAVPNLAEVIYVLLRSSIAERIDPERCLKTRAHPADPPASAS